MSAIGISSTIQGWLDRQIGWWIFNYDQIKLIRSIYFSQSNSVKSWLEKEGEFCHLEKPSAFPEMQKSFLFLHPKKYPALMAFESFVHLGLKIAQNL